MSAGRPWLAATLLFAPACMPENLCDPGYYEDHGACYPITLMDAGMLDASMTPAHDAGPSSGAPGATFGTVCTSAADCGPMAPSCGAPMLPYCTALNCTSGQNTCPPSWRCFDIRGVYAIEGVDSICLKP